MLSKLNREISVKLRILETINCSCPDNDLRISWSLDPEILPGKKRTTFQLNKKKCLFL